MKKAESKKESKKGMTGGRGKGKKILLMSEVNAELETMNKKKSVMGRPTDYTEEFARMFCADLSSSLMSVKQLCESKDSYPSRETVYQWISKHKYFADMYIEAKRQQQVFAGDTILDVAHDETKSPERAKLIKDALAWQAVRLKPDLWSEKKQTEVTVKPHEDWLSTLK